MKFTPDLHRGDVIRVRLNSVEDCEKSGERPALILSPDIINIHSPVILIAAITSKKTERIYPFEAVLDPPEGGLSLRSKICLMQIRSIDKRHVIGKYGSISEATQIQVEDALKIATGLYKI